MRSLTGQRFGRLTVIEKTDKRAGTNIVWKCRCDCGNVIEVSGSKLCSGWTKSCGCLIKQRGRERAIDLIGQRFGKLTVLEKTDKRSAGSVIWRCQCDCGNICEVAAASLKKDLTKSCGCLQKDNVDLMGQRFGRLTVLEKTDKRSGSSVIWRCQCDCGNICEVASVNLRSGWTKSCGCLQKDMFNEYMDKVLVCETNLDELSTNPSKANSSGRRGVSWDNDKQKWRAYIQFQHKIYRLGDYDKFEDAVKARERAEEEYWQPILEEHGRELK